MVFKENESVYAYHGPLLFKAQVLEKTERTAGGAAGASAKVRLYRVHYSGWDAHWDEWVPESRLLRDDAGAEEEQKQRIRDFKRAHNKRKAQEGAAGGSASDGGPGATASADGGAGPADGKKAKGGVEQGDEALAAEIREQLRLPQNLKLKLVEDWERVSREKKLVPLPRSPSIETLLCDFVAAKAKRSSHERLYTEVCDGLRAYFNQPAHKDSPLVELYGAEHLLRLAMKLPELLSHAKLQREHMTVLVAKLMELLKFLQSNKAKYFVTEYQQPGDAYLTWWGDE